MFLFRIFLHVHMLFFFSMPNVEESLMCADLERFVLLILQVANLTILVSAFQNAYILVNYK